MTQQIYQVDAFTHRPFAGNPAAVCVLDGPADEAWMRAVAMEMNLSETAFLHPEAHADGDGYRLRWFTPTVEEELCGHATLASAHILWSEGHVSPTQTIRFFSRSGLLTAVRRDEWIELDFPALPATPQPPQLDMLDALGIAPVSVRYFGRSHLDYLVEVASAQTVRDLTPDFGRLRGIDARGIIVTAVDDGLSAPTGDFDFISRFFAPADGIDEDPVTGSAHCCLAPFWASRLHKTEMIGYQSSARGGVVKVRLTGDRVKLQGQAVTVMSGTLLG